MSEVDLGAKSTPQTCCCVLQTIPEPFLLCGTVHYPAEKAIPFPWKGVHGLQRCLASCQRASWCHVFPRLATHMHPAIHMMLKKTGLIRPDHLFPLLHGPVLMLKCPCSQWTGSAWTPWLFCGYAATYATNCDALCILTYIRAVKVNALITR